MWSKFLMPSVRQTVIQEVDAMVESRVWASFLDVRKVIKDPADKGVYADGQEFLKVY